MVLWLCHHDEALNHATRHFSALLASVVSLFQFRRAFSLENLALQHQLVV